MMVRKCILKLLVGGLLTVQPFSAWSMFCSDDGEESDVEAFGCSLAEKYVRKVQTALFPIVRERVERNPKYPLNLHAPYRDCVRVFSETVSRLEPAVVAEWEGRILGDPELAPRVQAAKEAGIAFRVSCFNLTMQIRDLPLLKALVSRDGVHIVEGFMAQVRETHPLDDGDTSVVRGQLLRLIEHKTHNLNETFLIVGVPKLQKCRLYTRTLTNRAEILCESLEKGDEDLAHIILSTPGVPSEKTILKVVGILQARARGIFRSLGRQEHKWAEMRWKMKVKEFRTMLSLFRVYTLPFERLCATYDDVNTFLETCPTAGEL
ncbi:MAG: hypothetical protein LBJ70_04180 [Holosporales bacterium]|jgi:hypothetical protein|nr:hypothetical protein [Holosporales bacterium]